MNPSPLARLHRFLFSPESPLHLKSISTRCHQSEWMDDPNADPVALRQCLEFISRLNRVSGNSRFWKRQLKRFSRRWKPGQTIRIIDIGTGSADIPRAILAWSRRAGFDVRIVGVDRHAQTVAFAARTEEYDPRLLIVCADALNLPMADGSFDYAIASGVLHHFDDESVMALLRMMNRVATRGIIVVDLLRCRRLYWVMQALGHLSNSMFRHDAVASVLQAFTPAEIISLRDRAGVGYATFRRQIGHRFILAGEKA